MFLDIAIFPSRSCLVYFPFSFIMLSQRTVLMTISSLLQYYTDPESGYVFRTLKDCICYIEHGVLSKHAFKPNINSVCKILAFEQDFLVSILGS